MPLSDFALCTLVMFTGAVVHGSVGLGMALVAAPFLVLIDPQLVPAPLIVTGLGLATAMYIRERDAVDIREIRWAVAGCLIGTILAVVLLLLINPEAFNLLFGIALLVAVGISLVKWKPAPTPAAIFLAGSVSGLMGTTTSVGGPPMALVYQRSEGARLRATLAAYFAAGGAIALAGLLVADRLGIGEIKLALHLVPGMLLGLLVSNHTKSLLRPAFVRPVVLILCTAAAVFILIGR